MSDVDESKKSEFVERLLKRQSEGFEFASVVLLSENFSDEPPSLNRLIWVPKAGVSNLAVEAMDALEELGKNDPDWKIFRWRLWAFLELQDIFDMPIYAHFETNTFFRLWYFYYESKYILLESILAGLNGLYQSSQTLLRPFLEFGVLQNYYYRHSNKSQSYYDVGKCLKTGIKPKWATLIKGALDQCDFNVPIRARICAHYDALSENYLHPYHQDFSQKVSSEISFPEHSLVGIMSFWRSIDLILESVLWMYYANFPMIFYPKDLISKFGYNGPMGLFVDVSQGHIFKKSLSSSDLTQFEGFASKDGDVSSLSDWYNSLPDLTHEDIKKTWNSPDDGEVPDDPVLAKIQKMAKMRAMKEALSVDAKPKIEDLEDFTSPKNMDDWRRILSKKKRKRRD